MKARAVVNLVGGGSCAGKAEELTDDEYKAAKDAVAEIFGSSGDWQVSIESENGSWACFPKASVLYLEFEVKY